MLVDQYMGNGVEVTFFGRKTKANPTLARLLRQVECPVHGVRIIRLPGRLQVPVPERIVLGAALRGDQHVARCLSARKEERLRPRLPGLCVPVVVSSSTRALPMPPPTLPPVAR